MTLTELHERLRDAEVAAYKLAANLHGLGAPGDAEGLAAAAVDIATARARVETVYEHFNGRPIDLESHGPIAAGWSTTYGKR